MTDETKLQTRVGFFLLLSLGAVAAMIISFGRLNEGLDASYQITVTFPNAQGLIQGAPVNLAGSRIGRVSAPPRAVRSGSAVEVQLRLQQNAAIKEGSLFSVVDVGMLGDKAINISPPRGLTPAELEAAPTIAPNAYVDGTTSGGLGAVFDSLVDLKDDAKPILQQLDLAVRNVRSITGKIDETVITPEMVADLHESIKRLRSVLTRTDQLLAQAQRGQGPLATLLTDKKVAADLAAFISNVRRRGILFYSDLATREQETKERQAR